MRTLTGICALVTLGVATSAIAERIPDRLLSQDYETCMRATANSSISQAEKQLYCACTRDEIGVTFSLEEYSRLSIGISTGVPDSQGVEKLRQIANKCMSLIFGSGAAPRPPNTGSSQMTAPATGAAQGGGSLPDNRTRIDPTRDAETRLREINRLRDQGLLSPAEYDVLRRRIIEGL